MSNIIKLNELMFHYFLWLKYIAFNNHSLSQCKHILFEKDFVAGNGDNLKDLANQTLLYKSIHSDGLNRGIVCHSVKSAESNSQVNV